MDKTKQSDGNEEILEYYLKGFRSNKITFWYYDISNRRIIYADNAVNVDSTSKIIENVPQSLIESGYIHPDSIEKAKEMYDKINEGEEIVETDVWVKPLGTNSYVLKHLIYILTSYTDGKPTHAIGISKDITDEEVKAKCNSSLEKDDYSKYFDINEVTRDKFFYMLSKKHELAKQIIIEAIKNDELEVYIQPKIDIEEKRVCGAEGLIRWNHPKFGMISPKYFVGILESQKLIDIVDRFCVSKVLSYQKEQIDKGHTIVPISSNLSEITLSINGIAEFIQEELQKRNLAPEVLVLEITETAFVYTDKIIMENVNKLKKAGLKISMDDFGAGASSLYKLSKMPVDSIKLGMDMVKNAVSTSRGNAILLAVVQLAKALDLDIVAEGMETLEEVDYIREAGCRICQCYYFSKPMHINEFYEYIMNKSYKNYHANE